MSRFEDGSYGSLKGVALIAKALAGRCGIRYTRAVVGSGTIPEGMTPKTMTGAAGYVMDARIANVGNPVDGECQVTIQIKSDDVTTGFYATNIVLMAEDPDEGEIAFTYLSLENEPEWVRPASSIVGKLATFDLIAAVGDVDTVTAVIDPEAIATVGAVEQAVADHNADPDAHRTAITEAAEGAVERAFSGGTAKAEIQDLIRAMIARGEIPTGGIYKVVETTLAASAWVPIEPENGYNFIYDIVDDDINASLVPQVIVSEAYRAQAAACGVSFNSESFEGYVRLKSIIAPTEDIPAVCYLLGSGGGGGTFVLPVATADTLGGVKIGDGINVEADGTASVDMNDLPDPTVEALSERVVEVGAETDENAEEMLNEVFDEDEDPGTGA